MSHNYDDMVIITDDASDYWRLDTDVDCKVNKAFQNASDGGTTSTSATNLLPAANNNGSTAFDGTDDYVTITYLQMSQGLSFPSSGSFSIECWIKPSADQSASSVIGIFTKPGSFGLYLTYGAPTFFIQSNGDGARTTAVSASTVSSGSVYHLVGVYKANDGSSHGHLYLYVNGSQVADTQCAVNKVIDQSNTAHLNVGSWDTSTLFFQGNVSNCALYDGALTTTQISNHHGYSG